MVYIDAIASLGIFQTMRRADRLFQIVLMMGRGRVVTARQMAEELEVSLRTIYRDIADLVVAGTPIDGAAGVGYRLQPGYQVPPLMFDSEELEALAFGAVMVRTWTDASLARAAERALAKVDAVLPNHLRGRWDKEKMVAPNFFIPPETITAMSQLRQAIGQRLTVDLTYRREAGECTQRIVWPLGLVFWGNKWTLAAWCAFRNDFRTFRLDRITALELRSTQFPDLSGRRFKDYIAHASGQ